MYLLRKPILALSGSDAVRDAMVAAPVTRPVVSRFIAGAGTADAVRTVGELRSAGLQVTMDFLGEGVVERLVVRGPTAPSWHRGLRSVSDARGPRDTYG